MIKPHARRLPLDSIWSSTAVVIRRPSALLVGKNIHSHIKAASRAHKNNEIDPILATRGTASLWEDMFICIFQLQLNKYLILQSYEIYSFLHFNLSVDSVDMK
jgi:hypothetical protein